MDYELKDEIRYLLVLTSEDLHDKAQKFPARGIYPYKLSEYCQQKSMLWNR